MAYGNVVAREDPQSSLVIPRVSVESPTLLMEPQPARRDFRLAKEAEYPPETGVEAGQKSQSILS